MPRTYTTAPALSLAAPASLPPLSRALVALAMTLARWDERRQSRRALARLDPHMLRDVGLSAAHRDIEAQKAFWRA
ncbi:DUF1127 domain-containing protein [Xinfangfangia pollutisoli]|mgnify:CR=1 FL=1|uniref:DUF1127 domain-containing protein n=1 Tax=Xinfangfangia pollutisoli TaxID=2865960 RepID=UPI001CD55179|nr:DUF1127 domain-containing protein [Xinfangfangia pollutisoli]